MRCAMKAMCSGRYKLAAMMNMERRRKRTESVFARNPVSIGVFRRGLSITVKVRWTGGYAKGNGGWGKGTTTYSE